MSGRRCGPGSVVFTPGGVPHTFRVESDTAKMLVISHARRPPPADVISIGATRCLSSPTSCGPYARGEPIPAAVR